MADLQKQKQNHMSHASYKTMQHIVASFTVMLLALLFLMPEKPIQASSCGDLTSYEAPVLTSVTVTDDGLDLIWEATDDSRFVDYVILAAKNESTPETGVNGYLTKLTNQQATGYSINGYVGYTLGDFVTFSKNTNYYFAIGIEYDCGYNTTSNVIQAKFPDLSPPELTTPIMNLTWGEKGVILSWNTIDHEYLKDIRVVASDIDPTPSYPDNGYVAILNTTDTSYVVNNSDTYTNSNVTWFAKDKYYYFALVARYEVNDQEYYVVSDVKRAQYQGPAGGVSSYYETPVLTKAKSSENGFELEWNKITNPALEGYAIIASKNGSPTYPYSGYAAVVSPDTTTYVINNVTKYTGGDIGGFLQYGQAYDFSIVALYGNEYRSSSSYHHEYIGSLPSDIKSFIPLNISSTGNGYYKVKWDQFTESRLAAMYLVVSEDEESPTFSADSIYAEAKSTQGYFTYNLNEFKFYQNSFKKGDLLYPLEVGKTYNAALTIILRDGTSYTSGSTSFTFDPSAEPESEVETNTPSDDSSNITNQTDDQVVLREQRELTTIDRSLLPIVKGRVLLQVESAGEGWYVDPISEQKFYLKDAQTAFTALRNFGLGITNADLAKIPVGFEDRFTDNDADSDGILDKLEEGLGTDPNNPDSDGDGFSDGNEVRQGYNPLGFGNLSYDNSITQRLAGRIVLQVESRGQAWYINPADGKRYYMQDGQAAFDIMRFLSLGISNENLRKISVGVLE